MTTRDLYVVNAADLFVPLHGIDGSTTITQLDEIPGFRQHHQDNQDIYLVSLESHLLGDYSGAIKLTRSNRTLDEIAGQYGYTNTDIMLLFIGPLPPQSGGKHHKTKRKYKSTQRKNRLRKKTKTKKKKKTKKKTKRQRKRQR